MREKIEAPDEDIELEDNALFSLIGSYRRAMKSLYKKVHKVTVKLQSISSRIVEMSSFLKPGTTLRMVELFSTNIAERVERSRHALITFLSLLELGKLGFVSLYQTEIYGDIHVQTKKPVEGDVLSKVEEYGNLDADQISQNLFANVVQGQVLEDELTLDDTAAESVDPLALTEAEQASLAFDMATDAEIEAELNLLEQQDAASGTEAVVTLNEEPQSLQIEESVTEIVDHEDLNATPENPVEKPPEEQV